MTAEIRHALTKYMDDWIAAHAEAESFRWTDYWYDRGLAERMGAAAYAVFMASREGQDAAKEHKK